MHDLGLWRWRTKRQHTLVNVVASFAAWPPGAPGPVHRLLRNPVLRGILRRLSAPMARCLLRPMVWGAAVEDNRVTICVISYGLTASGAPKVVLDMSADLVAAGYQVVVLSHADGPYRSSLVEAGASVIIDQALMTSRSHSLRVLRRADAVICNTLFCRNIADVLIGQVPVLLYVHEAALIGEMLETKPSLAATFRGVTAVWTVSERSAAFIRPIRPDVLVVAPGIAPLLNQGAVPPLTGNDKLKLAVFAGLEARKGHDLLAAALMLLTPEERARVDITVYGEVLEKAYAEAWCRAIAGLTNYRYAGPLAPHDVAAKLIAVDGVIVPSRDESLSLVAVEALSVARLVLCSDHCGVAHSLKDGVSAFVAEDSTPEALAAMVARALHQPDRWRAIAEAGHAIYLLTFTRAAMARRILAAIQPFVKTL